MWRTKRKKYSGARGIDEDQVMKAFVHCRKDLGSNGKTLKFLR